MEDSLAVVSALDPNPTFVRVGDALNDGETNAGAFFNINAFQSTPASAGRFGNCGIGILEGPGQLNVNSGLSKTVVFHDHYKLRFEATFTNILNRLNFAPPQTNISNPGTFGALAAVLPQGLGGNRTGQFAARLDF